MAAIRSIIACAALSAALLTGLSGCASNRFGWTGTFEGNYALKAKPGEDQYTLNSISKVRVVIKENDTFDLLQGGMQYDGTIHFEDGKAKLKIEKMAGRPIEALGDVAVKMNEPLVLTPVDKDTVTFEDPLGQVRDDKGDKVPPLRLKRVPQPGQSG
jgi:hypothetical protein